MVVTGKAKESLKTVTGGLWSPEKIRGYFNGFKVLILAQENADDHKRIVSSSLKTNSFSSIRLRKRLGILGSDTYDP